MAKKTQPFEHRQMMKQKTFEIFHYRDNEPKLVQVHYHDFYEIYFFMGGNVLYLVEGDTYSLNRGDLLLISPLELHQPIIKAESPYERMVLWIDRSYLESLCTEDSDLSYCFRANQHNHVNLLQANMFMRGRIAELFELLIKESRSDEFGAKPYAEGLLTQLLVEVNRAVKQKTTSAARADDDGLIHRITSYINTHYQEDISLDSLAKRFFINKYYLSHKFSNQTGIGVYRYLILKRLSIAKEMLAQGMGAIEVSRHCGFHNYPTFYRVFKAEYGISPSQYVSQM